MKLLLFSVLLSLLCSCKDDLGDWKIAKETNDIQSFEGFIKKFPQSKLKDSAAYYIDKLAYDQARLSNTLRGYKDLIKKYPDNRFVKKLSKANDEAIIDSLSGESINNAELTIFNLPANKIKTRWSIPPNATFNAGGMILQAGPEGNVLERESPDTVFIDLNAETIIMDKDLIIYLNKNTLLLSGSEGSNFKRLESNKLSLLEGVLYIINIL